LSTYPPGTILLLAVPWADRAERRFPFLFPLALFGAGLLTRYELVDPGVPHTAPALWLFALGWAVARARNVRRRARHVRRYSTDGPRGSSRTQPGVTLLVAGILLLVWLPSLPVPKGLRRLTVLLASASLHAYLVHWLVYPLLDATSPALAVAASLAAGVAYWALCTRVMGLLSRSSWATLRRRFKRSKAHSC
jgi:hypothetical protein